MFIEKNMTINRRGFSLIGENMAGLTGNCGCGTVLNYVGTVLYIREYDFVAQESEIEERKMLAMLSPAKRKQYLRRKKMENSKKRTGARC